MPELDKYFPAPQFVQPGGSPLPADDHLPGAQTAQPLWPAGETRPAAQELQSLSFCQSPAECSYWPAAQAVQGVHEAAQHVLEYLPAVPSDCVLQLMQELKEVCPVKG